MENHVFWFTTRLVVHRFMFAIGWELKKIISFYSLFGHNFDPSFGFFRHAANPSLGQNKIRFCSKTNRKSRNLTSLMVWISRSRREDSPAVLNVSGGLLGVEIVPKHCPDQNFGWSVPWISCIFRWLFEFSFFVQITRVGYLVGISSAWVSTARTLRTNPIKNNARGGASFFVKDRCNTSCDTDPRPNFHQRLQRAGARVICC